jgi:chloramphenicol-sensitive protein RarD
VVIFGALFFKERATRFQLISLAISFAGVLLALWDGGGGNLLGDLLGIASSVSAGFSVHYSKRARARNNSWNIYLWVCMAGLLATAWSAPEAADAASAGWGAISILILSGAIYFAAQIAFTWGLKFTSAASAGILSFLKVPLAILFGALFMGEAIGLRFALGGALVTAGILVLEMEGRFGKGKAIEPEKLPGGEA